MFDLFTDMMTAFERRLRSRRRASVRGRQAQRRSTVALEVAALEDRRLLSGATFYVGTNSYQVSTVVNDPSQLMFMGGTAKGQDWGAVPTKTFTFTNNSTISHQTIYPFLYSPNNNPLYDPIDTKKEEYRVYVGYTQNGNTYLGVPWGKSITVNVPLVFWNGGRADIANDGAHLIPKPDQITTLNPFNFFYAKNGVPTGIYIGGKGVVSSSDGNGVLMYYHSYDKGEPNDPNPAAAGQLAEWTIRDKQFLTLVNAYDQKNNIGTIPASELTTLINYDVSYVDDLIAPVAMEAAQVPLPIAYIQAGNVTSTSGNGKTTTTFTVDNDKTKAFLLTLLTTQPNASVKPSWQVKYDKDQNTTFDIGTVTAVNASTGVVTIVTTGSVPALPAHAVFVFYTNSVTKDFGWTGAENTYAAVQKVVQDFTSNDPKVNGLGQYFGGLGWPAYYNSDPNLLKIPGGANVLVNSPLTDKRSPYGQLNFMLNSSGTAKVQYGTNGVLLPANQSHKAGDTVTFKVTLSTTFTLADLKAMQQTLAKKGELEIYLGPKVVGAIKAVNTSTLVLTVKLTKDIPNGPSGYSLDIRLVANDPYATKLRDLWYSWAKYYVDLPKFKTFDPKKIPPATVSADSDSPNDTRVLTFAAAQPQLALGMKVSGQGINGLITIARISDDKKQFFLSAPVPVGLKGKTVQFTFASPEMISTYKESGVKLNLINADKFGADKPFADAFAASVFETMAMYSTIKKPTIPELPRSMGLVYECIGGGVGHLPTSDFVKISADARDLGKSVLRGVPDFNDYPNKFTPDSKWKLGDWYPTPSKSMDGANYNVFNLDPYVWFVHQKLGLSGYGFSFDDDASDIGAPGTSTLNINFAGLKGFTNPNEWYMSTPWGTVKAANANVSLQDGKPGVALPLTWDGIQLYNQVRPDDRANSALGAYLAGTGIVNDTRILQLLDGNNLRFQITQKPSKNLPYTTDLTFTGAPPKTGLTTHRR
jgi:hypothetical protein